MSNMNPTLRCGKQTFDRRVTKCGERLAEKLLNKLLHINKVILALILAYAAFSSDSDFRYSVVSRMFLQDEVRANTDEWISLGMHGNQSGPLVCEATLSEDRRVGPFGKQYSNISRLFHDLHAFTGLYPEGRGGYYTQRGGEGTIPRGKGRVLSQRGGGNKGGRGWGCYTRRDYIRCLYEGDCALFQVMAPFLMTRV